MTRLPRLLRPFRRGFGRFGARFPSLALHGADLIGEGKALFRGEARRQLARIFRAASRSDVRSIVRRASRFEQRNRLVSNMIIYGRDATRGLIRADLAPLPDGPVVFAMFHAGPILAFDAYLERLPAPAYVSIPGRSQFEGAKEFVMASRALGRGESVMIAVDGRRASSVTVPFFGTGISLARGPFALARHACVPVRAAFLVWRGLEAHVVFGDDIPVDPSGDALASEMAAATALARWLQDYLSRSPGDVSLRMIAITVPPRTQRS
jgi:hypothetical protein